MDKKHKRFVHKYLELGTQKAAYMAVYPHVKESTAECNSWRLMKRPDVKNYLQEVWEKMEERGIANAEEVLMYLSKTMRNEQQEEVVVNKMEGDGISKPVKVRKKVDVRDRNRAAEQLAKHLRLFEESKGDTEAVEAMNNIVRAIEGQANADS